MGQLHNELRRSALSSAITRALGDTKGESGIERFGETLTPVMDLWSRPEWSYLRRESSVGLSVTSPAVVAEYSGLALINPAGSAAIAVIERIGLYAGASQLVWVRRALDTVFLATYATLQGRGVALDSRNAQASLSPGVCLLYYGSDAGTVGATVGFGLALTTNIEEIVTALPYVLTPGEGFALAGGTVNVSLWATMRWRERKALPGELE